MIGKHTEECQLAVVEGIWAGKLYCSEFESQIDSLLDGPS